MKLHSSTDSSLQHICIECTVLPLPLFPMPHAQAAAGLSPYCITFDVFSPSKIHETDESRMFRLAFPALTIPVQSVSDCSHISDSDCCVPHALLI